MTYEPEHEYSSYQKSIFKDIGLGSGHTLIIARAGCGKTFALVEGSRYVPKNRKVLFCAFNKSIAKELQVKLGKRAEAMTLHSLGFRGIRQRFGNVNLDNDKCWNIVSSFIADEDLVFNICKAVGFCKMTLTDVPRKIEDLLVKYDIDTCEIPTDEFIGHVIKAMRMCKEDTKTIDFNDMVWFCFVYRINVGKYDYVFLDEAHDLNKAEIELAISACKDDGRIIAVIDPRQAIYSWAGADAEVLNNLRKRLNPKELMLPICYRCPKRIVYLAQRIVPDIQSYKEAIDGEIIDMHINDLTKYAKAGSYIVSRVNAPLVRICLSFLKENIPANILGRDIGKNLLHIIKKSKKKTTKAFLEWLPKWEAKEKETLLEKYPKASTEVIDDKVECLNILCNDAKSIKDLHDNIDNLFKDNDENSIVLLSSIHRIKGKQTGDVFVLTDTLRSHSEEELNLKYISFTRSMSKLYLVYKDKKYYQPNETSDSQ
jgi:DNA helicase-2/ATP-dependent DNA helicase PcrA